MLELFIDITNQVFWEGYAQQLSAENPPLFKSRFKQFVTYYDENQTAGDGAPTYFNKIIQNNYDLAVIKQLQAK